MKRFAMIAVCFALLVSSTYAAEGEMGCFGGISTGIKMETLLAKAQTDRKNKKPTKYTLPYKENIYLTGKAETVEGTIEVKPAEEIDKEKGEGKYNQSYKVTASNKDGSVKVSRNITFETEYRYDASLKQTTKNTKAKSWTEIVTVNGKTYQLDKSLSDFSKSVLEDYTPGVMYYRGDVHYNAVYTPAGGNNGESNITISVSSPIYGYEEAYAKSESQKRTITIDLGSGEGYAIEETPTCNVYRDIEYGQNEPTAISMDGNYKEVMRSEGSLSYNIIQGNASLYEDEYSGMIGVSTSPTVEQLSFTKNLNLAGHPAEPQIKKMFSMKIFDDNVKTFNPNMNVTRKQYIVMLTKALQLELPEQQSTKRSSSKKKVEVVNPFSDVAESDPSYRYLMGAYNAGLIDGGNINGDASLTREYLYTINMRAIGLQRLGLVTADAYTAFVDDNQISNGAKASIYAASKLGIVTSANGYVFPRKNVSYAECATFLDQLINYLRYELQKDYIEKMLY